MSDLSRNSILALIDSDTGNADGKLLFESYHIGQWLTREQSLWL